MIRKEEAEKNCRAQCARRSPRPSCSRARPRRQTAREQGRADCETASCGRSVAGADRLFESKAVPTDCSRARPCRHTPADHVRSLPLTTRAGSSRFPCRRGTRCSSLFRSALPNLVPGSACTARRSAGMGVWRLSRRHASLPVHPTVRGTSSRRGPVRDAFCCAYQAYREGRG